MSVTLVLVPGLAGDETLWRSQLDALAPWQPRVSTVHMRESTIEGMAAALLNEHAGNLVLCGASMGGMVAMEAARQAPGRILGLALLGTSAAPESPQMRELREAAIELFERGEVVQVIEPNIAYAFHPDHAAQPALVADYMDFVLRAGAQQLARQNRALISRPDARRHLAMLRCPVLVMCGEDDRLTPPECSREILGLVPHARLRLLARCGHMLTMERPHQVNAALQAWLQEIRPGSGPSP